MCSGSYPHSNSGKGMSESLQSYFCPFCKARGAMQHPYQAPQTRGTATAPESGAKWELAFHSLQTQHAPEVRTDA